MKDVFMHPSPLNINVYVSLTPYHLCSLFLSQVKCVLKTS